jgi:hypothetical protein
MMWRKERMQTMLTYDHDLFGIGCLSGMHRFKLLLSVGHEPTFSGSSESLRKDSLETCRAFSSFVIALLLVAIVLGGD